MPHPRPHVERTELPEYPVRPARAGSPRPARQPVVPVWQRYPIGSRLVALVLATVVIGTVVGALRSSSRDHAASGTLVVDDSASSPDGGLAPDTAAGVSASASASAESPAPFVLGTLPPTVGTPPSNATVAQVTAAVSAARAATGPVVKPAPTATTARSAKPATTAKPVVKPAPSTTKAPKSTTPAQAVVKPPVSATTPRTTRPPAATTTAPKRTWTTEEVQALIRQIWPADSVDKALQVAYRESRYRATAYNGWCCYGVFQINGSAHLWRLQARGLGIAGLYDAKVNIEIALDIFNDSGWGPWGG